MEKLFHYLVSIGKEEGIIYFAILCLFLAGIPYYGFLYKYFKQIILKKELKIVYFEYSTAPYVSMGKDSRERTLYALKGSNNFLINGCIITFIWKTEGALKIDLLPIRENIKGNAASTIINSKIKKYALIAYGIKGGRIERVIDLSGETFYNINTNALSTNQKIIREAPLICTLSLYQSKTLNMEFGKSKIASQYTQSDIRELKNWHRKRLCGVFTHKMGVNFLANPRPEKKHLYDHINDFKILKSYSFSTKKYQSIK